MANGPYRPLYLEFTPTEEKIRDWICDGMDNKTIARYMRTTEQVVKNMIGRMFNKVGCSNRIEFFLMIHPLEKQVQDRIRDLQVRKVHMRGQLQAITNEIAILEGKSSEKDASVFDLSPHPGGTAAALADMVQDRG